MNDDVVLYIDHGNGRNEGAEDVYIQHEGDEQPQAEPKQPETTEIVEETKATEESEPIAEEEVFQVQNAEEAESAEAVKPNEEAAITDTAKPNAELKPAETTEPIEEKTKVQETPLDKIDQITTSTGTLPLPSEETEGIEPLMPY